MNLYDLKSIPAASEFLHRGTRITVRAIDARDIELLRIWKNNNRRHFLFQQLIEPEQQKQWFERFSSNANDQIYICEAADQAVACVGFRKLGTGGLELYNLM